MIHHYPSINCIIILIWVGSICSIWQLIQKPTTDQGAENKSLECSYLNETSTSNSSQVSGIIVEKKAESFLNLLHWKYFGDIAGPLRTLVRTDLSTNVIIKWIQSIFIQQIRGQQHLSSGAWGSMNEGKQEHEMSWFFITSASSFDIREIYAFIQEYIASIFQPRSFHIQSYQTLFQCKIHV